MNHQILGHHIFRQSHMTNHGGGWKFTLKFALRAEIGPEDGNLK
jgi:hypothetical protein